MLRTTTKARRIAAARVSKTLQLSLTQLRQAEKAAKKAGVTFHAYAVQALMEKIARDNPPTHERAP